MGKAEDYALIAIDNIIKILPSKCINCDSCRVSEECLFESSHWKERLKESKEQLGG